MRKAVWGFLTLAGIYLVWGPAPAVAQVSVIVSPLRIEHKVAPGASETDVITVKNKGGKPARVKIYQEDWQLSAKGELAFARAGKNPLSCAAWLQVNPNDFRIEAGQTRQVRYTLTVPPGAKEGGYWSAIIIEAMPVIEGAPVQTKMMVHGRVAVVVYETVGNPEVKAQIKDLQITPEKKGVVYKLSFANQGTGYYRVKKGHISLKNDLGQEVEKLVIPEVPVLPASVREVEVRQDKTLPRGNYRAEAVVDVGRRELLGRKQTFSISQ